MRFRFSFKLAFGILLATSAGCATDPLQLLHEPIPSPTAAVVRPGLGSVFQLRVGEVASIQNGILLVAFRGIRDDSRCPSDTTCVWQGDAVISIGTAPAGGPWKWAVVHTGVEPMSVEVDDFRITVAGLDPIPTSGTTIPQTSYQLSLRVDPVSESR